MTRVRETILVEGRYDKHKLKQIVEAQVIETRGFGIFRDVEKRSLLQKLAETRGVIVLTDSDGAGFMIRNHLRGVLPKEHVKHAYIPRIPGKERRKGRASKEGILGVEGMEAEIVMEALRRAGATFEDGDEAGAKTAERITKADLYLDGLSGREGSEARREELIRLLGFPRGMSANALLEAMNILIDRSRYRELVAQIAGE